MISLSNISSKEPKIPTKMEGKYYFINAFLEVDCTDNPVKELRDCGNLFKDKGDAIKALQEIRLIIKKYGN